jgi:hypothetical protein
LTAKSLPVTALFREKAQAVRPKPSPFEEAVRKDSAVHVSLSSDSPVKQPGNLAVSTPWLARKPTKQKPPTTSSEIWSHT